MIGAVRSEIRKLLSTRLWWALLLGIVPLAFLLAWGMASILTSERLLVDQQGNSLAIPWSVYTAVASYHGGINIVGLTLLFPLALGIVLITNEFRHETMSWTVLATPRRWRVYTSKVLVLALVGALYGIIHVAAGVAGASLALLPRDLPFFLDTAPVWTSFGAVVLAMVLWALMGFGFGLVLRNQVAAVAIGIGATFILQIAVNPLLAWREWGLAYRLLPGNLTTNMLSVASLPAGTPQAAAQSTAAYAFEHWWMAALILLGYAVALALVGAWLDSRRDIS